MQALPIWQTVPLFLLILGVLVLVHEFGHFITAKLAHVEAPEFGLGFPPRLFTFWRTNGWIQIQGKRIKIPRNFKLPDRLQVGSWVSYRTRDENGRPVLTGIDVLDEESRGVTFASQVQNLDRGTMFTLNAIPFGGFVRMTGEDDPSGPNAFASKPAWQRAIILLAGVTMNFLLAFLVFTVLAAFIPQPVSAATTQIIGIVPDSPAAQSNLRVGDTIVSVNGVDVRNNREKMLQQLVAHCDQPVDLGIERTDPRVGVQNVTVRLTPHPANNVRCAVGVLINVEVGVKITHVETGSLADQIGLRAGDALVRIGDFQMIPPGSAATLRPRDEKDLAEFIKANSRVKTTLQVEALRDGQPISQPGSPLRITIPENIGDDQADLGLAFHLNALEAAGEAAGQMSNALVAVPRAFRDLVSNFGRGSTGGVVGPLGIGQIVAEGTPSGGLPFLISVIGVLSLNLAIFNLLPFPGLDGGRLAFVIVEILRGGRKLDPRKEGIIHLVGFMVLLGFILFISYFDVTRALSGKSPFTP